MNTHLFRPACIGVLLIVGSAIISVGRTGEPARPIAVKVGVLAGDFRGSDGKTLQAAVDYVAGLGGGTVHIGPGRYQLRNALRLRDNVKIIGEPGQTILVACDGLKVMLACDGDCNERQITLDDARGFQVGDGVVVLDERHSWGYYVTTATLTARVGDKSFRLSQPLYLDYMMRLKASASLAFPVVGGWNVKNVAIEGLTIEGNRDKSPQFVDGCRAGGIYLHECAEVVIRHCTVRHYNGDGIVFGVSQKVTVEDCLSEHNAGQGIHPGSGSQHPIVRRNRALHNGRDGLFVCWRVQHGLFEDNEIRGNKGDGISIGHRDSDNTFRNNRIKHNHRVGVLFRDETEPMGAHRNLFEKNIIQDNATALKDGFPAACIVIQGHHHDLVFKDNTIGNTDPAGSATIGIFVSKHALRLRDEKNTFTHVASPALTAK